MPASAHGFPSTTDCKRPSLPFITLRHGPHGKHINCPSNGYPLFLPGVCTDTLPSNGHPVVTRLSGKVFTGSLPSNDHIRHNTISCLPDLPRRTVPYRHQSPVVSSSSIRSNLFGYIIGPKLGHAVA
jgi:hypothetical protein